MARESYFKQEQDMLFEIMQTNTPIVSSLPQFPSFLSPIIPNQTPLGEDPAPIINPTKIGNSSPINTPVYKKTKIDLRNKTKQQVLNLVNEGKLIKVGDGKIDPKHFALGNENLQSVLIFNSVYYLERKAGQQFLLWVNEMKLNNIPFLISSAIRFGKNTGGGAHGYGIAVDFSNLYQIVGGSKDKSINRSARISTNIYKQISTIGAKYNWYNPWRLSDNAGTIDEIWHFEYWGPA